MSDNAVSERDQSESRRGVAGVVAGGRAAQGNMKDYLDLIDKSLGTAFKLGVFVGGLIFLLYCESIGYLPRDMSLGDGFFLVFVASGFGAVYILFSASLTCLGILMNPLWNGIHRCYVKAMVLVHKVRGSSFAREPLALKRAGLGQCMMGIAGACFVIGFALKSWIRLPLLLAAALLCTMLADAYENINSKLLDIDNSEERSIEIEQRRAGLVRNKMFIPLMIFIAPLLVGGVATDIIAGAMRLMNIRRDDVVVNVRKPYSALIAEGGVAGAQSALGEEFTEYTHVNILLSGIGSNAVLSLKTEDNDMLSIAVPADQVLYSSKARRTP